MNNGRMKSTLLDCHRLACFLGVFATGVEDDYVTPLIGPTWKDPTGDKDQARALTSGSLWDCCALDSVPVWLRESESQQRLKHGTLSRRPPYHIPVTVGDSLKDQVDKVLTRHPVVLKHKAARHADRLLSRVFASVKGGLITPISLMEAALSFDGKTSLGYPRFVSDKSALSSYYEESYNLAEAGFPLEQASHYPGLIGARSVSRGPYMYSKTRFITQWSRVLGNWEKTLFTPLFDRLVKSDIFCAWRGQRGTDEVMTRFMRNDEGPVLSLDYTGFDASVPFEVINRVFTILKTWFVGSAAPLIDFVHAGFVGSGLFTPGRYIDGTERKRGVPSGSVLTNLIDCLVNLWVMEYACALNKGHVRSVLVQGDDGVYTFRGIRSIPTLASTLQSELGMIVKMEPDKNLISSCEVKFLQNHHRNDYEVNGLFVGVRPVMRALCNMMGHERAPMQKAGWERNYNTYRWLQQANNCANHPRFTQLCLWLWSQDGYMKEALGKILRSDREVAIANALLDVGRGERGKLPVRELLWSPVIQTLLAIRG